MIDGHKCSQNLVSCSRLQLTNLERIEGDFENQVKIEGGNILVSQMLLIVDHMLII